jgi:glutamyl-tRNA synthetase/glutamyl-Q tRNA(Asp) synthetase
MTLARRTRFEPAPSESFDDLRLGAQIQDPIAQCGDLLARDRHGNFTYQFAVVVDDLEQGVDLVIRGEDLLDSTGRQLRLAKLLGRAVAPRFLHHPLVVHPDGRKLSKSSGDTGIRDLRSDGRSGADVLGLAAALAGVGHDGSPIHADALAALFE